MIRRSFALIAAAAMAAGIPIVTAVAQESRPYGGYGDEQDRYSSDELDNLVGSVALYPDALLAQVLVAATFPDQITEAARFVRANGTDRIDDQSWDVSVKAVAHYPSALNMMADKIDWTTALGRAYANQSSSVMAAVQRMRAMADAQGNLQSTPQQNIVRDDDNYVIAPMNPRVIYVPVYDPYVVYTRPIYRFGYGSSFWSFGIGFPIGGWLSYDCNWRARSVYYNGWDRSYYGYAGGWRGRSAPYIHITNVYVNPRYRNVYINRDVIHRRVEYRNVDRYPGVHRETRFGGRDVDYRDGRDRVRNGNDRGRADDRARDDRARDDRARDDRARDDRNRDDRTRGSYGGYGTYGRTDDRGTWNRTDDRSNDRGNDRGGDRGNSRDGRQSQDNGGRQIGDGRGGSIGGNADDNRGGRQVGDGRGGSIGAGTPDNNRGGWGRDRPRDDGGNRDAGNRDGGNRDRGTPQTVDRAPWGRNEAPMVNPHRTEPQAAPQGNGGQIGGQNGGQNTGQSGGQRGGPRGGDRQGRERPKF
jgi:Protein of unknown function (DUF3300)